MSYTHIHLPTLDSLKRQVKDNPSIVKYYKKYGALLGDSDSIDYICKLIQEDNEKD